MTPYEKHRKSGSLLNILLSTNLTNIAEYEHNVAPCYYDISRLLSLAE